MLKESLHIISVAIFYYEIKRLSSLKHELVMGKKSLNGNKSKGLAWGLIKNNHN